MGGLSLVLREEAAWALRASPLTYWVSLRKKEEKEGVCRPGEGVYFDIHIFLLYLSQPVTPTAGWRPV